MNQAQVTPQTILVSARRSETAGHIVPPMARSMGLYETLESLVPFNHSMPNAAEYADLLARTRPYDDPVPMEVVLL